MEQSTNCERIADLKARPDDRAWEWFNATYRPLLESWLSRYGLQRADVEDLVQETLQVVVREFRNSPGFQYDPAKGRFRSWLRQILGHRLRDFWRRRGRPGETWVGLADYMDPKSDLSRRWDEEDVNHELNQLNRLLDGHFAGSTLDVFRRLRQGQNPAEIASDLKISENAVYLAKSSIIQYLRQELPEALTSTLRQS